MDFQLDDTISLSYQWEILPLSDGSIFFDSIKGNHLSIAEPSDSLRKVLDVIGLEVLQIETILSRLESVEIELGVAELERILSPLISRSILMRQSASSRFSTLAMEKNRYATALKWMEMQAKDTDAAVLAFEAVQKSRILILGQGALGCVLSRSLAASGVGFLRIVDGDLVEEGNLTRQIFFTEEDIGLSKVHCIARDLAKFNSEIEVDAKHLFVKNELDLVDLIADVNLVILTADSPRFLIEKWVDSVCKQFNVSYVMAHAGTTGPFYIPGKPGCFNCVEIMYEEKFGKSKYQQIKEALLLKKVWRYPSFVAGSLRLGSIICEEVIKYLSGIALPVLNTHLAHISSLSIKLDPINASKRCSCRIEAGQLGSYLHGL